MRLAVEGSGTGASVNADMGNGDHRKVGSSYVMVIDAEDGVPVTKVNIIVSDFVDCVPTEFDGAGAVGPDLDGVLDSRVGGNEGEIGSLIVGFSTCGVEMKGQYLCDEGDLVGVGIFEGDEADVPGGAFLGDEGVGRLAERDPCGAQRRRCG